eukprot:COSAG04_NODE_913_length_9463_cov_71.705575_9_plen_160_part_00
MHLLRPTFAAPKGGSLCLDRAPWATVWFHIVIHSSCNLHEREASHHRAPLILSESTAAQRVVQPTELHTHTHTRTHTHIRRWTHQTAYAAGSSPSEPCPSSSFCSGFLIALSCATSSGFVAIFSWSPPRYIVDMAAAHVCRLHSINHRSVRKLSSVTSE